MDEELGFVMTIIREPGDDTVRLAYADWLEDRRDQAARAEFIRLGCRLAQIPHPDADGECASCHAIPGWAHGQECERQPIRTRMAELWREHESVRYFGQRSDFWDGIATEWSDTDRGFLSSIEIDAAAFRGKARLLLWEPELPFPCYPTVHPIQRVRFVNYQEMNGAEWVLNNIGLPFIPPEENDRVPGWLARVRERCPDYELLPHMGLYVNWPGVTFEFMPPF